jgi:hypothetical protein
LRYVVISPDVPQGAPSSTGLDAPQPDIHWIAAALLERGVLPALGHFLHDDPHASARALHQFIDRCARRALLPAGGLLTDHLLNDMPRAPTLTHAWRTDDERLGRGERIREMNLERWSLRNLSDHLGPVPAAIIERSLEGLLTPCLNFDGEHVDLAICKRLTELIGAEHLLAITDRVQGEVLAGVRLRRQPDTSLRFQEDGIVAAGSQALDQQIANMRFIGLSEREIWQMVGFVPRRVLGLANPPGVPPAEGCSIDKSGVRSVLMAEGGA